MEVVNDKYRGYVEITHHQSDVTGTLPDKISIRRKLSTEVSYTPIGSVTISAADDLDFTAKDYYAIPGKTYDYICIPVIGTTDGTGTSVQVTASFVGILIQDSTNAYVCGYNPKITSKRNCPVSYVKPFNSRTPHAVSNGSANYDTGNCTGIFLPIGTTGEPTLPSPGTWNAQWNKEFLDFMTNRRSKLLKVFDGRAWYVHIDDSPYEDIGAVGSISSFNFNWTEVGDIPTADTVVIV